MFKRVAPYIGEYKKYTVWAVMLMTLGIIASVVPYFFLYQIITDCLSIFDIGNMQGCSLSGGENHFFGAVLCFCIHQYSTTTGSTFMLLARSISCFL